MKLVFPVGIWVPASQLRPPQSQAREAELHLINTGELEKPQRPEGESRTVACLLLVHSIYLLLFFLLQIRVAGAPSPQSPARAGCPAGFGFQEGSQGPLSPKSLPSQNELKVEGWGED